MNHDPRMTGEKTCHGPCGRTLPVIEFAVDKRKSDGLNGVCRSCQSARSKKSNLKKEMKKIRGGRNFYLTDLLD